jgi:hypothetical protein
MPPAALTRLDAWIARQPEPRPTRPEAIRQLVEKGLLSESPIQSEASLDRKIAKQETAIAEMPQHSEPSPEAGMAAMGKAVRKTISST